MAIPAILVAGFDAGAKAQVIAALLRQKPADQQWALIAAPRTPAPAAGIAGVWIEEVAPGCPCCTGLTPFSAGLTRLLRRLQGSGVTRLLIEGGPEGHIAGIARLLAGAALRPHVVLAGRIAVLDPGWIVRPAASAQAALRELAGGADCLVASGWEQAGAAARSGFAAFAASFDPPKPWRPDDALSVGFGLP
jgi:G3E family GTPase